MVKTLNIRSLPNYTVLFMCWNMMNSIRNCSIYPLVGWGIHSASARPNAHNVFSLMGRAKYCCTICRSIHYQDISQTIISQQPLSYKRFYHSIQKNKLQLINSLPMNQLKMFPFLWLRLRTKAAVASLSPTLPGTAQPNNQDGPEHDPSYKLTNQFSGNQDREGPVMHLSSEAALVCTKNNISICNTGTGYKGITNDQEQNLSGNSSTPKFVVIDNKCQSMSEEVLLSHTNAYVRRVLQLGATGESGDIEYAVEGKSRSVPKGVPSGALPTSAMGWQTLGSTKDTSELPALYAALAKSRLTGLVMTTALGGYVLSPMPFSAVSVMGVCLGTALISAAANTTNQILEAPYDAQMKRTANRVLVKGLLTPLHAAGFAAVCGAGGVGLLWVACNPLTAVLGATNLLLYTAVYTPMKRKTIANTWMGAVVGAIPPLMGWCGSGAALLGADSYGAWLMAGLLFAWQFPHFNALSWNLRPDYSRAGYRMMCVTNPRLCKLTCIRYSLAMLAIGFASPVLGVTTWTFAIDSTPLNAVMLYLSYRFYRDGDSSSSRNLFRFSLVHLPAVIVLMIISKKYSRDASSSKPQDLTGLADVTTTGSGVGTALANSSNSDGASVYCTNVVYNRRMAANTLPITTTAAVIPCEIQLSTGGHEGGVSVVSGETEVIAVAAQAPISVAVDGGALTAKGSPNAAAINLHDDRFIRSNTREVVRPSR